MKKRATSSKEKNPNVARRKAAKAAAPRRADSPDDSNPLAQSAPAKLAGLLQLGEADIQWRDEDLAAIFKHQLAQPLLPIAEQYLPARGAADAAGVNAPKITTFGKLFASASPPAEMLDIVRHYARDCRTAGDQSLPAVIAGALYWSAIAAGIATGAGGRSKLSKIDLEVGLKWLGDQAWVTPPLRKIAMKAATRV